MAWIKRAAGIGAKSSPKLHKGEVIRWLDLFGR